MVECHKEGSLTQLVLEPNRSMSWETNKKILLGIFFVNMTIALVWSFMGAWMVLPFAGLEVLCVGIGMYYARWKFSFKHVMLNEAESFKLQKGIYYPKQEWQWQKKNVTVIKRASPYRMSAPTILLKHLNDTVEVGDFLNRKEKKTLVSHFKELGLHIVEM